MIHCFRSLRMMFDPPDFPYREFSDTFREPYDTDDLLLTNTEIEINSGVSTAKSLAEVTELMISSVENQLSFTSNEAGRYFNAENTPFLDSSQSNIESNTELYIVQPTDTLFNYEPTLLDENTVNQFLLPLQTSAENNKDSENNGPDLLSLHSCIICHDIFTTDSELLDHTILVHASVDEFQPSTDLVSGPKEPIDGLMEAETCNDVASNELDFEAEWLVCSTCSRVLSTALEVEPSEQLCCKDVSGKGGVTPRKLHTMYVCDFCSGLFADGDSLDEHRITCFVHDPRDLFHDRVEAPSIPKVRPDVFFPCSSCSKQYPTPEELKAHLREGHPSTRKSERRAYTVSNANKMWNCGSCNQLFATARELYRHKRGEDRPPGAPLMAYVCEECDKVLGSMCALHTHKKMHKVTKPGYPCRVCGRRFNQSGHLAIHMRMHTGERPYPCDLCPKAFKVKVERDDHRRTHTGERPFACPACPKTFTAAARLREHSRIHTDQRPYRCEICGAAFRRPYARTVHTLIHTGEKPHECDICGTAFRRSGDMWKHKRTLHGIQAGQDF